MYLLTIWTIIGHIFILIAISTNKQLKQNGTSNILIGNLAFSDLLLGLTVLPFSATFDTFKIWTFGQLICDIWLSIDILCCTASIWGLLMIALDRYIATNHPIKYRLQKKNIKIGLAYCSISWLISILISLGPLAFYNTEFEDSFKSLNGTNDYICVLFHKPSFVVLSSIGSFYLPLVLMIILYLKVFFKIRHQGIFRDCSKLAHSDTVTVDKLKKTSTSNIMAEIQELNELVTLKEDSVVITKNKFNICGFRPSQLDDLKKYENRTTKILVIIMTSFVVCWLPFFVVDINSEIFIE